ncbi:MAG: hypothetical protein V1787_01330 [Candidatus Micrarchaeota archaeon]
MRFDAVNLFLSLLIVMLLAASAASLEVMSSADAAYITSTEAQVFVYAKNPFAGDATVRFSATSDHLNAYYEPYTTLLRKGATSGALLRVTAPDCFRGDEYVYARAQVCTAEKCETGVRKIRVSVTPARTCENYIEGFAAGDNYVPSYACGATGCYVVEPKPQSKIVDTASFDATTYALRLVGGEACTGFIRGGVAEVGFDVRNRGASGSFDVRVVGSGTQLEAYANREYISIARSGSQDLKVYAKAEPGAEEGRHFVSLQLLHGADVIGERDLCVEIEDIHESGVKAPASAEINPARDTVVQAEISNGGTDREGYSITLLGMPGGVEVEPQGFWLEPGESRIIDITFSPGALKAETATLEIIAEGEKSEARARVALKRKAVESAPGVKAGGGVESGGSVFYDVEIQNGQDFDLKNLTFEVQGLPQGWEATVPESVDILAGRSATVKVGIRQASEEEAEPVLLVKQGEKVIARQMLPKTKGAAAGLTGFLTLSSSQNMLFIAIIVLLALIVIIMVTRIGRDVKEVEREHLESLVRDAGSETGEHPGEHAFRRDFAGRLHNIRHEAGK